MIDDPEKSYFRWHAAAPDPTGLSRGADADMLAELNRRTMEVIQEEALKLNAKL